MGECTNCGAQGCSLCAYPSQPDPQSTGDWLKPGGVVVPQPDPREARILEIADTLAAQRDRLQAEVARLRKQSSERASRAVALSDAVHTARRALERIVAEHVCGYDTGVHTIASEALAAMSQSCSEQAGTAPVSAPGETIPERVQDGAKKS